MYCSHFGLHRPPFNNTPDPTFYFSTPEHEEALATLQYATLQRKGFVLVTGEIGAGKTLVGRLFMRQIERDATVAVINHTHLNGQQLLAAICSEFEIDAPAGEATPQLLERLQTFLLDQFAKDRYAVVLLDEAQNLPNESFEELRMLGNLEADDAKLLQVCILGQPELRDRIRQPGMRQLDQRLFRRFHLPALNRDQIKAYIQHRLTVAGAPGAELFSEEAIDRIYVASRGVPRIVNQLCDNALLTAYGENIKQVSSRIIDHILEYDGAERREAWGAADRGFAGTALQGEVGPRPAPVASDMPAVSPELLELAHRQVEQIVKSRDELAAIAQHAERTKAELADLGARAARTQGELSVVNDQAGRTRQELHDIAAQTSLARDELHTLSEQTSRARQELQAVTERAAKVQDEWAAISSKVEQRWHATRGKLDEYRNEIQSALADAAARYQTIQSQFEALSKAPSTEEALAAVEDVRKGYLTESARILEQITQQRDRFRKLLADADRRWNDTTRQLTELSQGTATKGDLEGVENEFSNRVGELLGRFDLHRDQIGELAQSLQELCERTQRDLASMRGDQAEAEARIGRQVASRVVASAQVMERKLVAAQEAQVEAHARLATEVETRIAETRAAMQERLGRSEQRIESLQDQMNDRLASLNTALQHLEETAASAAELDGFRRSQAEAMDDLVRRLAEQGDELRRFREDVVHGAEEGNRQKDEQLAQIARQVAVQEERLQVIRRRVLEHLTGTEQRFESLAERFADRGQVEQLRADLEGQVEALVRQSEDGIEGLRREHQTGLGELRENQEALARQHREDVAGLRREHESDLGELRERQEAKAAEILKRIETNRDSMQKLISTVVQRWESTHRQLETVSASYADKEQLSALRSQYEQESKRLLDELAGHRSAMEEHFAQMAIRLQETKTDLEALSLSAARSDDVVLIQRKQVEEQERVLVALADQRRELDSMVDAVNRRCDDLIGRLTALPPDIATMRQMVALHRENMDQIRVVARELATRRSQLEQAIRGVAEHSRQTHVAVEALAKRTASVDEVRNLRQQHTDKLHELLGRLESESAKNERNLSVVAREVAHHARRVTQLEEMERPRPIQIELAPKVGQALGAIVETAGQRVQQLEDNLNRAEAMTGQLLGVSSRVQEVLRHWAENAEQVDRQSEQLRSSAVLAQEVIVAIHKCHRALEQKMNSPRWRQEMARGEQMVSRIEQAVGKAQSVREQLVDQVEQATRKTQLIREQLADRIEQAARKAQSAGENLETVITEAGLSQQVADEWVHRGREARQLIDKLSALMGEASRTGARVDETLAKRKQILAAVARNTAGLVDLIETARRNDEQARPTVRPTSATPSKAKNARPSGHSDVVDIQWPRVRVSAKAG
ncbi:MAG TPA: AAA family ATPase [Phycisphaerae bacterium]|nr:AAA family ATPase [Phycisphaerae bacterium]HRY68981.1 AAA family ATPase [Phycisphaerae bacterium]HSA26045.1 AAA family ATPase [Phycisphaerae bacterium]